MIITHKINADLTRPEPVCIEVVQDDKYTCDLQLCLTANNVPLTMPEHCNVVVRFRKNDGKAGCYDSMPDGSPAWSLTDHLLTVRLAPEVCTAAGKVDLTVSILSQEQELSYTGIQLRVQPKPQATFLSRDYINVSRFLPQPLLGKPGMYLRVTEVDGQGRVTAVDCQESAGVGITNVRATTQSQEDGGENIITVTTTDGSAYRFSVYNGSRGSDGAEPFLADVVLTDGIYSLVDCTYDDLLAAMEDNRIVQLRFLSDETFHRYYSLSHYRITDGVGQLIFSLNHSTSMEYITINQDGAVTRSEGALVSQTLQINGKPLNTDITLTADDVEAEGRLKRMGRITTFGGVAIDTTAKTMSFGERSYILSGDEKHNISNTVHDISSFMSGQWLYYDPVNKTFTTECGEWFVCLGAMWNPVCFADLPMQRDKLTVDGLPVSFTSRFLGKAVNVLGDSMTYGTGTTKAFHAWLPQLCGFTTINNHGVAGSCIAPKVDTVPTWEEGIQSFCERSPAMGYADAIIVFGGVNDWVTGRTLGTIADTGTDTFYGAMKDLCAGLIRRYPVKSIYVFSSPQNNYVHRPANDLAGTQWEGNTEGYNRKGLRLQDYTHAMAEVCAAYSIPFCSLTDGLFYGLSGLFGNNNGTSGIYGSDGLHPNAEGHKRIALKMAGFINCN